jgi:serine O-acetyltransferase
MDEAAKPARRGKSWLSPERLWLLSIALQQRGHRRLAVAVKNLNSVLYHNSLPPGASICSDIRLGHHGFGTVIHTNVVIGQRVKIWHNVTIAMRAGSKSPHRIIIEDDVRIGANSVIISPYRRDLRIGRGARIGAGAVISRDVAAGSTVVSAPPQVIAPDATDDESATESSEGSRQSSNGSGAPTPSAPAADAHSL